MANSKHYQELLADFVRELAPVEFKMLAVLSQELNVDFLLRGTDLPPNEPSVWALYWELTMRLTPLLQERAFGKGEFSRYCNPFFDPEVVAQDYWLRYRDRNELGEGDALLAAAFSIESQSREWPRVNDVVERYLGVARKGWAADGAHDSLSEIQEYLSRIVLRGEQESTIAVLRAHFELAVENARGTEDSLGAMNWFVDEVLPMLGYAYTRIRATNLQPLLTFYAATAGQFLEIIEGSGLGAWEENEILRSRQHVRDVLFWRIKILRNLRQNPTTYFPYQQWIGNRKQIANRFVSQFSVTRNEGKM